MSGTPFIELEKGNYISRIWFFYKDEAPLDVLMTLTRKLPDGDWLLKYRFRYYRDHLVHDSEDEKSHWSATFPSKMTEAEAIRKMSPVIAKLAAMTRMKADVTVVESDEPQVTIALMRGKPYFHMKSEELDN